jgi:hypothetical protein
MIEAGFVRDAAIHSKAPTESRVPLDPRDRGA